MYMVRIEKTMFREYDIRGIVGKDLTADVVELLGKAIGTYMQDKSIVVGFDNRPSSRPFRDALVKGLLSTGMNVVDIGLCITPVLYFALRHLKISAGVMITGSHNPGEYNGFKIVSNFHSVYGREIQKLYELMVKGNFDQGVGTVKEASITENYLNYIKNHIKLGKKMKIVLDCGNGTAGILAPKLLGKLGCEVTELYCESDGTFPNHHPDPAKPELYSRLAEAVKKEKADLGIAFDGDGDRIGVFDENGNVIFGDDLLILFSREVLERHPGAKICVEVKCSQAVVEDIKAHGGVVVMSPTGHSLIEELMRKENALLTGEMSGHMFFADEYFGYDDAIYASARLLRILSNTDKTIRQILDTAPKYFSTPVIRVHCPDDVKFDIIKKLVKFFKSRYEVIDIDGARVLFKDGWGLVRASNTQPDLTLRFEARTEKGLKEIENLFRKELSKYPEVAKW